MDVIWIIIDSLSASSSDISDADSESMPNLASLANKKGMVFSEAYVPGPKSPSSHGSFLTGQLPSRTGMHEAYPSFDSDVATIADALSETHQSYLVSSNPFLFNGLHERFDETTFLNDRAYLPFPDATDPEEFKWRRDHDTRWERYRDFLFEDGKPLRSLANGVSYKFGRGSSSQILSTTDLDDTDYQTVETMNRRVRSFINSVDEAFIIANYMDIHPPLNLSDAALEEWFPNRTRDDLPTDISGNELQDVVSENRIDEVMELYYAAIWDLDRKITPFIRELVEEDSLVIVTADHGNWFRPDAGLTDEKLHVPLILFGPGIPEGETEKTVNLVQLSATTTDVLGVETENEWIGPSILDMTDSQVSITEYIRAEGGGPVNPYGDEESICHDIVGIKDSARVDYRDGEFVPRGIEKTGSDEIYEVIENLTPTGVNSSSESVNYDESTEKRLKELGYLE